MPTGIGGLSMAERVLETTRTCLFFVWFPAVASSNVWFSVFRSMEAIKTRPDVSGTNSKVNDADGGRPNGGRPGVSPPRLGSQDSSKGGAVETGCSDLYDVTY